MAQTGLRGAGDSVAGLEGRFLHLELGPMAIWNALSFFRTSQQSMAGDSSENADLRVLVRSLQMIPSVNVDCVDAIYWIPHLD